VDNGARGVGEEDEVTGGGVGHLGALLGLHSGGTRAQKVPSEGQGVDPTRETRAIETHSVGGRARVDGTSVAHACARRGTGRASVASSPGVRNRASSPALQGDTIRSLFGQGYNLRVHICLGRNSKASNSDHEGQSDDKTLLAGRSTNKESSAEPVCMESGPMAFRTCNTSFTSHDQTYRRHDNDPRAEESELLSILHRKLAWGRSESG
jgi:hypothetical protein